MLTKGIDVNKINGSHKCIVYHWMILNDVATVSVKGNDNGIHFWYIGKDEGIHLFKNDDLSKKLDPYLI